MDFEVVNRDYFDDGVEQSTTFTIRYYDSNDECHYEFMVYGYGGHGEFACSEWENSVSPGLMHKTCIDAIGNGIYYANQSYIERCT